MMGAPLGDLSPADFLRDYWQKQPCLIRQAIPGFAPELDGDDLAGLACDELAEARIVTGHYPFDDWTLRHGPFTPEDFASLPAERWTLLVQDVEKHYPPLRDLMARFDFLPTWRLDDLMISYAATGGSVGPHVDQYDVFLLQAEGERLWQIAREFDPAQLDGCPLNVLQDFEPEKEWVLRPGDMLYLPPNVAHHGVALDPGMTWSVGLRAPGAADLMMALGEHLALGENQGGRYSDPDLAAENRPGEIDPKALGRLRELLRRPLRDDAAFADFAGRFISRFRLTHDPAPPDQELTARMLLHAASAGGRLVRNPWTRLAWVEMDGGARLFAAGDAFDCSLRLAGCLCDSTEPEPLSMRLDDRDLAALTGLVNGGHLVLTSD